MAQLTATTLTVTATNGIIWENLPLNPEKVISAYKIDEFRINSGDTTNYPAIAFVVDYGFKKNDNRPPVEDNSQYWVYAAGDTATRDSDFAVVNAAIAAGGGGGGGEINTASNVGLGDGIFKQKIGVDLQFKTLIAGSGISILSNPDDLILSSSAIAPNVISPPQITSNQDNYNPAGWAAANIIILDVDANREVTGFEAVPGWNRKLLINSSLNFRLRIKYDDAASLAQNRVISTALVDYNLRRGGAVEIIYNDTISKWQIIN
jgi:hypothetical protein